MPVCVMTGWIRLVPTTGGHLVPVPIEGEPPLRWVEDGVTYEEDTTTVCTLWGDDLDEGLKHKKQSKTCPAVCEPQEALEDVSLDEYAQQLASLLERRSEILNSGARLDRDDLIESMSLPGRKMSADWVQTGTRQADDKMVEIVDRLDYEAGLASQQNNYEIKRLQQIDRHRFKLSLHQRTVIDLVYYKGLSITAVAKKLDYTPAKAALVLKQALQALTEIVR